MAINWDDTEEATSTGMGDYAMLPTDGYVCTITDAHFQTTKKGKPAIVLLWDIAEGDAKGFFADDFYTNKDFKHHDYLMLDKPTGILKHKLSQLDRSNDGLRAAAAASVILDPSEPADKRKRAEQYLARELPGKSIGLVLQERKYTWNGHDQSEWNVTDYCTPDEIRQGHFAMPETIDDRDRGAARTEQPQAAATAVDVAEDDIPF